MTEINIYLAGAISLYYKNNQHEIAKKWRREIARELNYWAQDQDVKFKFYDPTIGGDWAVEKGLESNIFLTTNEYFLRKADIVIVNMKDLHQSPGTIYELVWSKLNNKTIIGYRYNKWINVPHVSSCFGYQCGDQKEVVELVKNMFV